MDKPETNRQAYDRVLFALPTQTALANHLGVARQYVSRWKEVPLQFAVETARLMRWPTDEILPETSTKVYDLLDKAGSGINSYNETFEELIRLLVRPPMRWQKAVTKEKAKAESKKAKRRK